MAATKTFSLEKFSRDFMGLSRSDSVFTLSGSEEQRRRVYLDTTATSLMPRQVWQGLEAYLDAASANSHTYVHRAGRDTTYAIEESRDAIGRLVSYDPEKDVVLFTSNGATGAVNFLARALFPPELRSVIKRFPGGAPKQFVDSLKAVLSTPAVEAVDELIARPLIVTTRMEHHSNLLPWFEAVGRDNVRIVETMEDGSLDFEQLRSIMAKEGDRVRLVAVIGLSNVTGIPTPVHEIAKVAHKYGAQIMVDGAQWVPHTRVEMHPKDDKEACIDYLVLSGHKLYAPGSRGALIGCLKTLSCRRCVSDVGGGMVEFVTMEDFQLKDEVTAREEAGTPNILGSIAMGLVAELLMSVGMDKIAEAEHSLTSKLLSELNDIEEVKVYGDADLDSVPRAGVVSFNVGDLPHGLVAAYLDEYHNIAVRNGCFCAQPYIQRLLGLTDSQADQCAEETSVGDKSKIPGMVRASLGVYTTEEDVKELGRALRDLIANQAEVKKLYEVNRDGVYVRLDGKTSPKTFSIADFLKAS